MANFSITGEFLTERIRDSWESKLFKHAILLGLESLEGSNLSHIVSIVDGEMKLVGVNNLELVADGDFKPTVKFLDVLNYAMIPNSGYFRIYDEDTIIADKIIRYFDNTHPNSTGDRIRQNYIREWDALLPEVKIDNYSRISHWMSVYMRKFSNIPIVTQKSNFYSINIIESEAPVELSRKCFDYLCDKFHIYSDREECWELCVANREMTKGNTNTIKDTNLTAPSEETLRENIVKEYKRYKKDITMASDYGWLSPDGTYKACEFAEHEVAAIAICNYLKLPYTEEQKNGRQLSDVLLKNGYIKIHRDDIGFTHITNLRLITNEQQVKIDRYKSKHNIA